MTRFYPRAYFALYRCLSYWKAQQKFIASVQGQPCPSQQTLLIVSITNDSLLKGEANKPDKQVKLSVCLISSVNPLIPQTHLKIKCLETWREIQPTCIARASNMIQHLQSLHCVSVSKPSAWWLNVQKPNASLLLWPNQISPPQVGIEIIIILEPNCINLSVFASNRIKKQVSLLSDEDYSL